MRSCSPVPRRGFLPATCGAYFNQVGCIVKQNLEKTALFLRAGRPLAWGRARIACRSLTTDLTRVYNRADERSGVAIPED
jgi:hypothetical protein